MRKTYKQPDSRDYQTLSEKLRKDNYNISKTAKELKISNIKFISAMKGSNIQK